MNFLKHTLSLLLIALMTVSAVGQHSAASSDEITAQEFAIEAARSSMVKIMMSEIAENTSNNEEVKKLAETISNDHRQAKLKLTYNSYWQDWSVPEEMKDGEKKRLEKLRNASPENIDEMYLKMIVKSHQKSLKQFRKAALDFSDESKDLSNWIGETADMLEKHKIKSENLLDSI